VVTTAMADVETVKDTLRKEQRLHASTLNDLLSDGTLAPFLVSERCRLVGGGEEASVTLGLEFQGPMRIQVELKADADASALPSEWNCLPVEVLDPAKSMAHLQIMDISGSVLLEDDVWRGCKVKEVKERLDSPEGDFALEESLFCGRDKLNDADTLDDLSDRAVLCLVASRRTSVSWTSPADGLKLGTASLDGFEPSTVVGLPMVRCLMGKGCFKGSLWMESADAEPISFDPPVEATKALAAVPQFADKDGWSFNFKDGSSLRFYKGMMESPVYSGNDGEERRLKNLGLEYTEASQEETGIAGGWQVPIDWTYKAY